LYAAIPCWICCTQCCEREMSQLSREMNSLTSWISIKTQWTHYCCQMRPTSVCVLMLINTTVHYPTPNSTHGLHPRPFYVAKVTVWFAVSSDSVNYFFGNKESAQERWPNSRSRSTSRPRPLLGLQQNVFAASVRSIALSLIIFFFCIILPLLISPLPDRDD
jgi:hypothetical protein